ncbi:MAG TPA: FAD-binding oxidoreductase [Sphingomicrobium sp.]|nr:FAD-binding oxidoreductase [Sphingomicrobium sp.]
MSTMAISSYDRDNLLSRLRALLPEKAILTRPEEMAPFLLDWRGREAGEAAAVLLPSSVEEVVQIVARACQFGVALFPQGGNTGLCYGSVPQSGQTNLVIGMRRMNRILDVDPVANVITMEAGAILANVHEAAAAVGRTVPLHLGSEGSAQIGGLVSTNAGGTGALRYGPMRDLVCGLQVVLPDGAVFTDLAALVKNNTGFDLKHLFVGAEGTLGVVTAVALRMHPAMKMSAHGWLALEKASQAMMVLRRLQDRFDTALMACELLSGSQVDLVLKEIPDVHSPFAQTPNYNLLIELGSVDAGAPLSDQLEELLGECLEQGHAFDAIVARSEEQAARIWRIRHSVSEANKVGGYSYTHDVAVRVSKVPEFIDACDAWLAGHYPAATPFIVAHLGDGNVHYIAMFAAEARDTLTNHDAQTIQTAIHDIAVGLGGSFSAEHGIGRKLVGELERLSDPVRYRLMRDVKQMIDGEGFLNPGVLFPARTK